jgi:hypothetical protein
MTVVWDYRRLEPLNLRCCCAVRLGPHDSFLSALVLPKYQLSFFLRSSNEVQASLWARLGATCYRWWKRQRPYLGERQYLFLLPQRANENIESWQFTSQYRLSQLSGRDTVSISLTAWASKWDGLSRQKIKENQYSLYNTLYPRLTSCYCQVSGKFAFAVTMFAVVSHDKRFARSLWSLSWLQSLTLWLLTRRVFLVVTSSWLRIFLTRVRWIDRTDRRLRTGPHAHHHLSLSMMVGIII